MLPNKWTRVKMKRAEDFETRTGMWFEDPSTIDMLMDN